MNRLVAAEQTTRLSQNAGRFNIPSTRELDSPVASIVHVYTMQIYVITSEHHLSAQNAGCTLAPINNKAWQIM